MSALVEAAGVPVWKGSKGTCKRSHLQYADVVVMAPASQPRHVAIVGDNILHTFSLIHADGLHGQVLEVGLSDTDLNMIVSIFRRPLA